MYILNPCIEDRSLNSDHSILKQLLSNQFTFANHFLFAIVNKQLLQHHPHHLLILIGFFLIYYFYDIPISLPLHFFQLEKGLEYASFGYVVIESKCSAVSSIAAENLNALAFQSGGAINILEASRLLSIQSFNAPYFASFQCVKVEHFEAGADGTGHSALLVKKRKYHRMLLMEHFLHSAVVIQ